MPNSLLKRTLVVSALVAVGATAAVVPAQAGGRYFEPDNIAHRGASGAAPENTIAAIELALDQDADFVEVEIQRTADGELIAMQDTSLARTTNAEEVFPDRDPWFVGEFTLAEIRQLDAGSWFGSQFAGAKVPTLDEVIDEVGYRNGLVIEIRNPAFHAGIEQDILDELLGNPLYFLRAISFDTLVVQSADAASAQTFADLMPLVEVGVATGLRPADADLVALSEWADRIDMLASQTDQAIVDRAQELGLDVVVHTVSAEDQMATFAGLGVDGIVTPFPALLDEVLD